MAEVKTELQRIAVNDKNHAEHEQFIRAVDSQWLDSRMTGANMSRCLAVIEREKAMEKENQEKMDHAAIINKRADREMALAREIELEKRRIKEEASRRQFLRENDPELKTLAVKLQAGYVCRDRRKQIADNQYRRLEEKIEERHNNSVLQKSLTNVKETEDKELLDEMNRKTSYRKELRQQMGNGDLSKQKQLQEKVTEKKLLDDMVKKYHDEDTKQLELKVQKRQKMYSEMLSSLESREEWKQLRRQQMLEAEIRRKREAADADKQKSGVEAERERKFKIKEEINMKVGEKLLAEIKAKQERTDLIQELRELEQFEKDLQLDEAEKIKEEQAKKNTKAALMRQMNIRLRDRSRERQNDMMEEKVAKEDAKELDKQQKRKEVMRKYSVELARQRDEDRKKKDVERRENEERNSSVWTSDTIQREEVRKEREKLLQEHAPHVLGYLQAGVLQTDDLPAVRRGANAHPSLAGLDIEAMGRNRSERKIRK